MNTMGPEFYKWMFQLNIKGQYVQEFPKVSVLIGNAKEMGHADFHPSAQTL